MGADGLLVGQLAKITSVEPPFDPQMGTYQLRSLLCRVSKYGGEQGTV